MPGNVIFFSFSFFLRTRWTNIGCFMLSDPELETSECTPTHPPTAYWQNTARIHSTGLTINSPPGTGDTFTYNNLMWSNCPCSQMIQNIPGWIEFLMYYEIWRIFSPFLFLLVFVLFASVFTHTVDSRGIKIKWASQWTSKESCGNWCWI